MSATRAFRPLIAATALLTACSQAPSERNAGAGGAGAGAPGHADAGAGANTAGANTAGTSAAGSAGTVGKNAPTSVTWSVIAESQDPSLYAGPPVAASRGQDAAVAYLEWTTTPSTARVVMQGFDAAGQRVGALVELGDDPQGSNNVSLASDGKQYAACWTSTLEVHCSLVDEQGQVHVNALVLAGQYATIVASPSGWAVGYETSNTQLRLQPLTPTLELSGSPVDLKLSTQFRYEQHGPLFTPTLSGFALVGASLEDGHDALIRLGADLQPVGSPIPLGRDFWYYGELAASDTRAAVSFSTAYGSYLLLLDTEQVTAELALAGGNKEGIDQALLISDGGIGAAWLNGDTALRRFFADGHDAEVGLGTHNHGDAPINTSAEGSDSYQQLLLVGDQTLLLAKTERVSSLVDGNAIRVGAVTFP